MIPDEKHPLFNALDRSKQYTRASNEELLRSLNEVWKKCRALEASNKQKDAVIAELYKKIGRYRVGYTTLVAIITGVCWEGVRALVPVVWAVLR